MTNGKGSKRIRASVKREQFEENWDEAFGKKKPKKKSGKKSMPAG